MHLRSGRQLIINPTSNSLVNPLNFRGRNHNHSYRQQMSNNSTSDLALESTATSSNTNASSSILTTTTSSASSLSSSTTILSEEISDPQRNSIFSIIVNFVNNNSIVRRFLLRRRVDIQYVNEINQSSTNNQARLLFLCILFLLAITYLYFFTIKTSEQAGNSLKSKINNLADYALDSFGGSVVGTKCTKTLARNPTVLKLMGIPLMTLQRSANTIINPSVNPGECYAFQGSSGIIVIRLAVEIFIQSVTLEHIPKSLSLYGDINSAPKDFEIYGAHSSDDSSAAFLGNFTYNDNGTLPLQNFVVLKSNESYQYVEFRINSNYGHQDYTCVYRLRVHGIPRENLKLNESLTNN